MQVVQVIHGIHNLAAGPTHSVARLTDELCLLGEQASILTLGREPSEWRYKAPVRIHGGSLARAGVSVSLMQDIRRLSHGACILHDHGIWRLTNLFPLLVRPTSPARVMCSPRGTLSAWAMRYKPWMKRPFWRLQESALRRCHCFHATSIEEYESIRRQGFDAPVAVIPNGVDIPEIEEERPRAKRVVFLSRIDPIKGLDILLPAWAAVAPDFGDWELVIAGPLAGDHAARMQRLAAALHLPRLRFAGEAYGDAKRALLSSSAVFVLPSYSENFAGVVAEALAHGTPVITTTATPWTDIGDRRCGWCIAPTEDMLCDALRGAMEQPEAALRAMGRQGREWMQRDYAWSAVARKMQLTYDWLMGGGERPGWVYT